MGLEYGLLGNNELPTDARTNGKYNSSDMLSQIQKNIQVGRVKDIIINKDYPNIQKYGGDSAIGTIFYTIQGFTSGGASSTAKPLFPQSQYYPLKDELVLILTLPNTNIGKIDSEKSSYYLNVINLWGAPNHNAYPETKIPPAKSNKSANYQAASMTKQPIVNSSNPPYDDDEDMFKSDVNPTQNTFTEKEDIHPLQPFLGDSIYQGRFGNSVRFSSTSKPQDSEALNNWSNVGENGNPITIFRNGQSPLITTPGWEPVTEDINNDLSSLYLTSTQQIPIEVGSSDYTSYGTNNEFTPTQPKEFSGNQVIINSGRLTFNSSNDHILLSSNKTINLNSQKGIYSDTPKDFVVNAGGEIKLGGPNACESLVLGDTLKADIDFMLSVLIQLVDVIQFTQLYPGGLPVPDGATSTVASNCKEALQNIKDNLNNILSTKTKTV